MNISSVYRVYRWEWVVVYTADASGATSSAECEAVFRGKYAGRVIDGEHKVDDGMLLLFQPNVVGEFKSKDDALDFCESISQEGQRVCVVAKGDRVDRCLADYSVRKLGGSVDVF